MSTIHQVDELLLEFIYGLECGYSICCVMWYCSAWVRNDYELSKWFAIPTALKDSFGVYQPMEYTFAGAKHILCPECIVRKLK